jgi:hypothetical protein
VALWFISIPAMLLSVRMMREGIAIIRDQADPAGGFVFLTAGIALLASGLFFIRSARCL